jgi:hypothetical protein
MFHGPETISRNPKSASRAIIHFPLECRLSCPRLKQKSKYFSIWSSFLMLLLLDKIAEKGRASRYTTIPRSARPKSPRSLSGAKSESPTMYFRFFPAPDALRFWDLGPSKTGPLRLRSEEQSKSFNDLLHHQHIVWLQSIYRDLSH